MIVYCPSCSARFKVPDDVVARPGARLKCSKCTHLFDASTAVQAEPGAVDTGPAASEWDSMVGGSASARPAPAGLPVDFDPLAEIQPDRPRIAVPRDPFYEANPLVVERPPAGASPLPPRIGYASNPSMPAVNPPAPARPDPFGDLAARGERPASVDLAASAPAAAAPPPAESSDPFANISLLAPASAPPAGSDDEAGPPPVIADRSARPAPPPVAIEPAAPAAPASLPAPAAPSAAAGPRYQIRDRSGRVRDYGELSLARSFVAKATDPDGLEVAVDGGAYEPVLRARAFADLSFKRSERVDEMFPPPPTTAAAAEDETGGGWLWAAGLGVAAVLLLLAGFYAAWQFELLKLDPAFTIRVSQLTGIDSPLAPPQGAPAERGAAALERAREAEQRGAFGLAIVHYRHVLALTPDDIGSREALARCYEKIGDLKAARDLRGGS